MRQYNLPIVAGEKGIFQMLFMHLPDSSVVAQLDIGTCRAVR
jgi:hypothetical protein